MVKCYFCGEPMIIGGEFTKEDYGMDGKGVIANLSCSNTKCNSYCEFIEGEYENEEICVSSINP